MKLRAPHLTALLVVTIAGPALAASQTKNKAANLGDRVAELEKEVARLKVAAKRHLDEAKRQKSLGTITDLRDKLLAAGKKARGMPELKKLISFAEDEDAAVRGYLIAALARLPRELSAATLTRMIGDRDTRVASGAIVSLGMLGDYSAKDVVAKRTAGLELWIPVRGMRISSVLHTKNFLIVACNYLRNAGDKRGLSIFMTHLERDYRRLGIEEGLRSYSTSWGSGLIDRRVLEQADKWTRGKAGFLPPKKHGHRWWSGKSPHKSAGELLAWWKKNGAGFALAADNTQAGPEKTAPAKPEKF